MLQTLTQKYYILQLEDIIIYICCRQRHLLATNIDRANNRGEPAQSVKREIEHAVAQRAAQRAAERAAQRAAQRSAHAARGPERAAARERRRERARRAVRHRRGDQAALALARGQAG